MKNNFASLAYLQNYRRLNIITRAISTNPNPHFGILGMQVFYTNVDNFVDRKNKRESYFYVSF